ncbi:MAG TPA: mandelate racemase/muconate lactonizing enzyme family protein [Burkholderiales bacterium]|nr:mandelate racemase/muconate lactonizing enzyme family protein [Burkholderiales bacterium]
MKLERWSLHFYRLPYAREIVWSNAVERAGLFALLTLVADDGTTGLAEGTVKGTWSGVSPRSLRAALEDLIVPALAGVDLADAAAVTRAWEKIPENRLAKGLVDNACWTLRAAAAGTPLWRLWGGQPEVDVCWTVTRAAPAAMARDAAEACARHGFRTLKVKGGQGLDTDLAALAEIRAAIGAEVALYVDANGAYGREAALDYVRRIAAAGVGVAEDPCPLAPDARFEALQAACGIPILIDSSCTSLRDAELYVARGARAVSLKPGRIGFSASRAIQAAFGPARHSALGIYAESALGTLINLQLPASLPAEQSFFLLMQAHVVPAPPIRGGRLTLPAAPDLASLVDWRAVERFAP